MTYLNGFKWNKILSIVDVKQIDEGEIKEIHKFNLNDESYNIKNQNIYFDEAEIVIRKTINGKVKVKGIVPFGLKEDSFEDYAIDCYSGQCDVFFRDLTLYLCEKPVKVTYNTMVCDDSVMFEAELIGEEYKLSDFDCVDKEDGGYDSEEVFEKLLDHGAILKEYVEQGVGGGNPQYFAYFPSGSAYKGFIKDLYSYTDEEVEDYVEI